MVVFDVPGKIFLYGEYAVLFGGQALCIAGAPRFSGKWNSDLEFHPDSPSGRLVKELNLKGAVCWDKIWPGFGSSTADYLATYYHAVKTSPYQILPLEFIDQWKKYLNVLSSRGSGVDLWVQNFGGAWFFNQKLDFPFLAVNDIQKYFINKNIWIFYAAHLPNQKTPTHLHLNQLKLSDDQKLILMQAAQSLSHDLLKLDLMAFSRGLTRYGDLLFQMGLEHDRTREIKSQFLSIPGVLGCKGSGAMGSDLIIVCADFENTPQVQSALLKKCEQFGLKSLGKADPFQIGTQLHFEPN